eukprot:14096843-Alexandrium_andersonii.AAC.1
MDRMRSISKYRMVAAVQIPALTPPEGRFANRRIQLAQPTLQGAPTRRELLALLCPCSKCTRKACID